MGHEEGATNVAAEGSSFFIMKVGPTVTAWLTKSWADYERRPFMVVTIGVAALILLLWTVIPGVTMLVLWSAPDTPGEAGDMFGSVNALFSGFAFTGVIITIWLQHQELKQNTAELRTQAAALKDQVRLMTVSARLAALPILIRQEKERVWAIDPDWRPKFREEDFSPGELHRLIESALAETKEMEAEIQAAKDELPGQTLGLVVSSIERSEHLKKTSEDRCRQITHLRILRERVIEMEKLADSLRENKKASSDD